METNKGDKGVTPDQTPAEVKSGDSAGVADSDNKTDAELEKRISEKKKQIEQLELEAKNLTNTVRDLRGERKEFKLFEAPKEESKPKGGDDDGAAYDESDDEVIDRKVDERLRAKTQEERIRMYNSVAERFIRENEEFDSDNDVGGELLRDFKVRATNTFLGETESQVQETLKFILAGIRGVRSTGEEKVDGVSDLGEIQSTPPEPTSQEDDWANKKLNKWEKIAAQNFPGGEKEYRKARAGIAKKK